MNGMKIRLVSIAIAALISAGVHAQTAAPKEASDFLERAEGCVHFGGEVPENPKTRAEKQRAAEVAKKIRELCSGNKRRLTALKTKFKGDKAAMEKISEAEKLLEESGALE
jgi:Skp family chaperone for outer membrane proteins